MENIGRFRSASGSLQRGFNNSHSEIWRDRSVQNRSAVAVPELNWLLCFRSMRVGSVGGVVNKVNLRPVADNWRRGLDRDPPAMLGLSQEEAQLRLHIEGFNDLPRTGHRSIPQIVAEVLREPMFALLLGAGAIYLVLGDHTEALVLLAFAVISISITVVQETRSERVLDALRDMTSPRALVIRDGARKRIPGREVVRGDAVIVLEGDRVPADCMVAVTNNLLVDESLLTGESVPVRKTKADCRYRKSHPGWIGWRNELR